MHKLFAYLACLATLTIYAAIAAGKSAKTGDVAPISNPYRDTMNASIEPEADGYATSFPCLVSCIPGTAGRVDGAHMSIDLKDVRQLYILYSDLIGALVMPPPANGPDPLRPQKSPRDRISPADSIADTRAARSGPTAELEK
jgi:hypothetical protein